MAPRTEPSKKVIDKHAKFLAAWEAAGFPDKFEYGDIAEQTRGRPLSGIGNKSKKPPMTRTF